MRDTTVNLLEPLAETLETMAFISILPPEDPESAPPEARIASIAFTHPTPGTLELVAPAALGRLLASNILGPEASEEEINTAADDALRELMNVTCGSLLTRINGATAEPFQMSLPQVNRFGGQEEWTKFIKLEGVDVYSADGNTIALRVNGL